MLRKVIVKRKRKKGLGNCLYILPKLAVFVLIYVFPLGMAIFLSFTRWNIFEKPVFIGFKNYIDMWSDFVFVTSLRVTLLFAFMRVPSTIFFSFILAILVNIKFRGRNICRTIYFIPAVSAVGISAIMWKILIFHPQLGLLNKTLDFLHLPPQNWLGAQNTALLSIVIFGLWWDVGFYMVIILGGLQSIPNTYYDAAKIDGASFWTILWRITLPLLMPVLSVVSIMCTIWSIQLFAEPFLLTKGGPYYATQSLILTVYNTGFKYYRMGYGCAMSMVLILIIFVVSIPQLRYFGKKTVKY